MDERLRALHLAAGLRAGRDRTCGTKVRYTTEASAARGAERMNAKPTTRNPLEAYPCAFCSEWHIGRRMSAEELEATSPPAEGADATTPER